MSLSGASTVLTILFLILDELRGSPTATTTHIVRRHKGNSVILSLKFDYKYYIHYCSTAYWICRFSFIAHVLTSAVDAELYMNARVIIVVDHSNTVNVTYAMVNFERN